MRKINKNGWGLGMEIGYICIFIFCLIISVVLLSRLGLANKNKALDPGLNDAGSTVENLKDYAELENKLVASAKKYVSSSLDGIVEDNITITSNSLINSGYLKSFVDNNNSSCSGYVEVTNEIFLKYTGYVKCNGFTSPNYDENKD